MSKTLLGSLRARLCIFGLKGPKCKIIIYVVEMDRFDIIYIYIYYLFIYLFIILLFY